MSSQRKGGGVRFAAAAAFADRIDAGAIIERIERLPAEAVLDLRELPAPEPMERILEACARLPRGGALAARTPRLPRLLLPHLDRRGLLWAAIEEPDGTGLLYVEGPPAA